MLQDKSLKSLMNNFSRPGTVEWIGIREQRGEPLKEVQEIKVSIENGLKGDHYGGKNRKRQVTLIQKEHVESVAGILGLNQINPQDLRRNLVVSGLNLLALKDKKFKIGEVTLEMTGLCHPCSRMEKNLGEGGYNAMRGHGGITARVLEGGQISLGNSLEVLED